MSFSSSSSAFSSSSGFLFFFFLAAITIARTRVPVCCNTSQNDVVWSLGDIKRCRFDLFYFLKSLPKTTSFGTKSLIQTTSFWISDLKQFKKDVVLESSSPKRRRFRMCAGIKKNIVVIVWISDLKQFKKDVVLDSSSPKRRRFRMCAGIKKNTVGIQNDAVLYQESPERRCFGCRTLTIVFWVFQPL